MRKTNCTKRFKYLKFAAGAIALSFVFGGCAHLQIEKDSSSYSISNETTASELSDNIEKEDKTENGIKEYKATFSGIKDYGDERINIENADSFEYIFNTGSEELSFKIEADKESGYPLQNILKEGYFYTIEAEGDKVISLSPQFDGSEDAFESRVKAVPGERTLKNFIANALMPVGNTLYIYGGGWNWQDDGAGEQTRKIGLAPEWKKFFDSQDEQYNYNSQDPHVSYFPNGSFNEYYYAGLDCSGFLGWTLYNTFEKEDGNEGYVFKSSENSKLLSERGWGSLRRDMPSAQKADETSVVPGDIISIKGHVWISLGTCKDGSIVMVHSSPSVSRAGQKGGGVQIAAIGNDKKCLAYRLADKFMSEQYPQWYERYEADLKSPGVYFDFQDERSGIFSWSLTGENGGLTDPEGIRNMRPKQLLDCLYDLNCMNRKNKMGR